jgi:hypothetical protein
VAAGKRKGLNLLEIPMQGKPPRLPVAPNFASASFMGTPLSPGLYSIRVIKEKDTVLSQVEIIHNKASIHSEADRLLRYRTAKRLAKTCNDFTYTVNSAIDIAKQAKSFEAVSGLSPKAQKLLSELKFQSEGLRNRVVNLKEGMVNDGGEFLRDQLSALYSSVVQYEGRPSENQLLRSRTLEKQVVNLEFDFQKILDRLLSSVNKELEITGQPKLRRMSREDFDKRKD